MDGQITLGFFLQSHKVFNQLHSFNTTTNKWSQILCAVTPVGKAGHGATVVGHQMVVFGGYHGQTSRLASVDESLLAVNDLRLHLGFCL